MALQDLVQVGELGPALEKCPKLAGSSWPYGGSDIEPGAVEATCGLPASGRGPSWVLAIQLVEELRTEL